MADSQNQASKTETNNVGAERHSMQRPLRIGPGTKASGRAGKLRASGRAAESRSEGSSNPQVGKNSIKCSHLKHRLIWLLLLAAQVGSNVERAGGRRESTSGTPGRCQHCISIHIQTIHNHVWSVSSESFMLADDLIHCFIMLFLQQSATSSSKAGARWSPHFRCSKSWHSMP